MVFQWVKSGLKRKLEELEKKYQTEMAAPERPALLSSRRLGKADPVHFIYHRFYIHCGKGGLQPFLSKCKHEVHQSMKKYSYTVVENTGHLAGREVCGRDAASCIFAHFP